MKYAAQFTLLRKNITNYVQRTRRKEAFIVAQTIHTGEQQVIALPDAIEANNPDAADNIIIRAEQVRAIA